MIVVTGGAGFIGSNIVKGLELAGHDSVVVVDHLQDGRKFKNLVDCKITDYFEHDDFINLIETDTGFAKSISAIFHEGACSDTTEWDGVYMMNNNYRYSRRLLDVCLRNNSAFIYASSASVYGSGRKFKEIAANEAPLNVYGYSKFLFDQHVNRILPDLRARGNASQIAGFRYFNVYGPREFHKGSMASVAWHFRNQIRESGGCKLFAGTDGYADGAQCRDFVYVDDVVKVNLWFLEHPECSGIFNVGTGKSQTFNEVADAVIVSLGGGDKTYIPFPDHLKGRYQSFTEAEISALRAIGYDQSFDAVAEGVSKYMSWLDAQA